MVKFVIAGSVALLVSATVSAQVNRPVNRPVARDVNRTTTVNRNVNVNVHHTYHPGNWNRARVRAGVYRYPPGYAYRRWVVGRPLPRVFIAPVYYYAGYAALGLAAPPANFQWVRYGPDLMLVNITTGAVVDIRYGVFA